MNRFTNKRRALLLGGVMVLQAPGLLAQDARYVAPVQTADPAAVDVNLARFAANARVARVDVEVTANGLPADGVSATDVLVRVFDTEGKPVREPVLATLEVSAGRITLPGGATDELGSRPMDLDRMARGTQLRIEGGEGRFTLASPIDPQDVKLRVTVGRVDAVDHVSFDPELRDMVAAGLVEGVIRLSRKDPSLLQPARIEDGFEDQLRQWSRSFNNGKGEVAARAAMFLKGKIRGDALLTVAADSEKSTRERLLRDIRPEEFYPVYGDASIKGFDARSADRVYVRIDKNHSYLLYGDFSTGGDFAQSTAGGATADGTLRLLGAYSRTLTGGRAHWEQQQGFLNVFATTDSLKQVVEEFRANGTSGPFVVRNTSALENSEKIEILVRDRDQLNSVVSTTELARYSDYSFEPFSGRVLFKGPVPSQDADGNPVSVRITYEVDQGGESFWLAGADGQVNLGTRATLGGGYVKDRNPTSPFELQSLNFASKLGAHGSLVLEGARSKSRSYYVLGNAYTNPTGINGETAADLKGYAWRAELDYRGDRFMGKAWWLTTDQGFDNPSSGLTAGRLEGGARGSFLVGDRTELTAEVLQVKDDSVDAHREGAQLAARYKVRKSLTLLAGLRYASEHGQVGERSFIGANPSPGSLLNPTGGFMGGIDAGQVNIFTGQLVTSNTTTQLPGSTGADLDSTSVFVGAELRPTDKLTLAGRAETSIGGDSTSRVALGASYAIAERARLYARAEENTGLVSTYSLDQGLRTRAFIFGVDSTYLQTDARTGAVFSEYRLRDAASAYESQAATGLRNTFMVRPGLALSTGAEYLKVLRGDAASAAALTFGLDYTASELWKGSTRLEARRAFNDPRTVGNDRQDSWLFTLSAARKLDRDWTALARNYHLRQFNSQFASGQYRPDGWQNRLQVGFAYRPVDTNRFDSLMKYEWKDEHNIYGDGASADVHIVSMLGNWHPDRRIWVSGRLAGKRRKDQFALVEGGTQDSYTAWLAGGRLIYDLSQRWDAGAQFSRLASNTGNATQYAYGVEVGFGVQRNAWISLGFNWSGYNDDDLTSSDYTNRGVYLRLRWKFDENLFKGGDANINRALDR